MDIEDLLRKADQDGCMVVLNDIAPNRERSELVFRVPESVYDTPVAALDIDESTKSALQNKNHSFGASAAPPCDGEKCGKTVAYRAGCRRTGRECGDRNRLLQPFRTGKRNFWERILHNADGDAM